MLGWFRNDKPAPAPRPLVAIRMEAIGGQGANSAGKILSDAAVTGLGHTGCHFASFGSEKRGSPVQSFVRFSPAGIPIRSAFFSEPPDLLVVFHEAMLTLHPSSLAGATAHTTLIVNSARRAEDLRFPAGTVLGRVLCVDAGALSRSRRCGMNAVMLGAMAAATPELDSEKIRAALERFFGKLSVRAQARNVAGFRDGLGKARHAEFRAEQACLPAPAEPLPRLGWTNATPGGVILNPGNTALRDHSLSRQGFAPRFQAEACVQCGYCDMVCPDYCFVWDRSGEGGTPRLLGLDYQFCKGCQKCVAVCPVSALTLAEETSIPDRERLRKFPGIDPAALERKWHGVDWNLHYPDEEEHEQSDPE